MAKFKNLKALAKAYADGKIRKQDKLVVSDSGSPDGPVAKVHATPVDRASGRPVKGVDPELVFEAPVASVLKDALRLAGIPS